MFVYDIATVMNVSVIHLDVRVSSDVGSHI